VAHITHTRCKNISKSARTKDEKTFTNVLNADCKYHRNNQYDKYMEDILDIQERNKNWWNAEVNQAKENGNWHPFKESRKKEGNKGNEKI